TGGPVAWNTYVAVDDADAVAARIEAAHGRVLVAPSDVGPAGRTAICADPADATFRLWQARARPGAQVVNEPGSWNFSDLHASAPDALDFYTDVFGWVAANLGFAHAHSATGLRRSPRGHGRSRHPCAPVRRRPARLRGRHRLAGPARTWHQ